MTAGIVWVAHGNVHVPDHSIGRFPLECPTTPVILIDVSVTATGVLGSLVRID